MIAGIAPSLLGIERKNLMLAFLQRKGRAILGGLLTGGLLTAALVALPLPSSSAPVLQGKVVRVSDGDTLVVQIDPNRQERVRLIGIDAPEMSQKPWGEHAKAFAEHLALGKSVRLEADVQPRDQYGRFLAYAYVGETFINYELVREGHAVLLTYPPNVAHVEDFKRAQHLAREEGKGIWHATNGLPESPREHRRQKRSGSATPEKTRASERPSRPVSETVLSEGAVIANAKSRIYHDQTCASGATIGESNRIVLPSAAEAAAKGFTACKRCGS